LGVSQTITGEDPAQGWFAVNESYGYFAPTGMSGDDGPILPSPSFAATLMESESCMSDN